jgi:hypothetical protein
MPCRGNKEVRMTKPLSTIDEVLEIFRYTSTFELTKSEARDQLKRIMAAERLDERKMLALDTYDGHTFSDATDWKYQYERYETLNERRIDELEKEVNQ